MFCGVKGGGGWVGSVELSCGVIHKQFKGFERGARTDLAFWRAEMKGHALWHNIKMQNKGLAFPGFAAVAV